MKNFFKRVARRIGFTLLFCASVFGIGLADAATYAYRNDVFSYDTPSASASVATWHTSGASPACTTYPNGDDDWDDLAFPAGFTFTFGGTNYSGVRVYSNGILAFPSDTSGFHRDWSPVALPAPAGPTFSGCPNAAPTNIMMPYWIDIIAGTANSTVGASVRYELLGTAPNRRFVISWVNVRLYNTTTRYNFQVVLYESAAGTNGNFHYRYTSGSSNGANATVGVQLSSTDYTEYSYNQQFIDTTVGTAILWYPANQLATKEGEYRFDEGVWTGAVGEIKDTSGNSQHAVRVGAASNVANGKLCRGGSFSNNTSSATIDAVATPLLPGATGSVGFWFRSNSAWNSTDAMLLDATATSNRPFFLMKRSTGALRFAFSDSAGTTLTANTANLTYAANTWYHIGVTWSMRAGSNQSLAQVFVNGALAASRRGTTNGTPATSSSLYVGDNRTAGVTPANGTGNGANGILDEVYVYVFDVSSTQFQADMSLTRPTCTSLDHFRITHGGTASSCAQASVTIAAHDQAHALFGLAGTTMTVSTSTGQGTWSAITAINPVVNTVPGTATYTFSNENSVVLGLNHPAGSVNINVNSGGLTEASGAATPCTSQDYTSGAVCDASLVFSPCISGFECVESSLAYSNLVASPASRNPLYTKLAGTPFTFDVVAIDAAGNRVTSYAADTDKPVTVALVEGAGSTACASRAPLSPPVSTVLTFLKTSQPVEQGRKSVSFTVGNANANLRCRVIDANQSPSVVGCSSDNFSVRPSAVALNVSPAMATPPSAVATPTLKAGAPFTLTGTTSSAAGYAGALTVDTGKLTAQIATQDSTVQSGGVVGVLTPAALTANTAASNNASYSEVGYLYLAPGAFRDATLTSVDQPDDCVSSTVGDGHLADTLVSGKYGCVIGNKATHAFGRFTPNHFDTETANACASVYTYSGQPFPLRVTARNASGSTTQNYAGRFAKTVSFTDANGALGTFGTLAAGSFVGGVADTWAPPQVAFTYTNKLTAPSTVRVRASDSDTNTPGSVEGTVLVRSGRLLLSNAHGSELLGLPVPIEAQFWNGSGFTRNSDDACTTLNASNVQMNNWQRTLNACETSVSLSGPFVAGRGKLRLTAPGAGNSGSVNLTLNLGATGSGSTCVGNAATAVTGAAQTWLQGAWAGGAYDQNPVARASFGLHRGSKSLIYMREMY